MHPLSSTMSAMPGVLLFLCLIFLLNIQHSTGADHLHYNGHRIIRLIPRTVQHTRQLNAMADDENIQLDLWNHPLVGKSTDVRVTPENQGDFIKWMQEEDVDHDVVIDDLESIVEEDRQAVRESSLKRRFRRQAHQERSQRRQEQEQEQELVQEQEPEQVEDILEHLPPSQEIYEWLDELVSRSNLTTQEIIGTTLEDRTMRVIKIGTGTPNKPYIFIEAGTHAREYITIGTALWIINKLVSGYNVDDDVTAALDQFDWYILPVANPDGYDYTHTHDRFWRKNRRLNPISNEVVTYAGLTIECNGVDLNRNFDIDFYGVASSMYCQNTYRGPWAFSEKETRAIRNFLQRQPQRPAMFLSFHAYSQLWMYPWGYKGTLTEDAAELRRVARVAVEAVKRVNGRQFSYGTVADKMGDRFSGLSVDWMKGVLGVKYSYVIEMYPDYPKVSASYQQLLQMFVADLRQIEQSAQEIWAGLHAASMTLNLTETQLIDQAQRMDW